MNDYMKEARGLAAQCWCDEKNSGKEMDADLAESVARRIANWMEAAAQGHRNADYYRGLLDECAKHLGKEAYTADDGTVMDEPLRVKIPELVAALKYSYQLDEELIGQLQKIIHILNKRPT